MVALNVDYPTSGWWTFEVVDVVADDITAVTRVVVHNDEVEATAVTFFTVVDGGHHPQGRVLARLVRPTLVASA